MKRFLSAPVARIPLTLLALFLVLLVMSATDRLDRSQPGPATTPVEPPVWLEPIVEMSHDGCHAQTTCSLGTTISCEAGEAGSGASCTTFSGVKVTCGTCKVECSVVDAYDQCIRDCDRALFRCVIFCPGIACEQACQEEYDQCTLGCGPAPPTSCQG